MTFITLDGYTNVSVGEQYLPVKFAGEVKAEDGSAGTGKTALTLTGFPEDYKKKIEVAEGFSASETEISYTNAKPGKYTVTVSDENGKYADMTAQFMLSTADIPVKYEDGKLVKADGFSDDDAANFIKNITSFEVNGNKFNASGRGAVKAFGEDGTVDFNVKSGENAVFDGSGNYSISITATGYTSPYSFEVKPAAETTAPATTSTTKQNTTTTTTTTAKSTTTTTTKKTEQSKTDSPKTGVAGAAIPAAALALAGMTAFAARKKRD